MQGWGERLGPEGPLGGLLSGLERRDGQVRMAELVDAALRDRSRVLLEAGTGVGKTFAYLLPALGWADESEQRLVVSTWTRNLQEQIVERDLPLLRRAFAFRCSTALVQGRQNYVCRRRAEEALDREAVQAASPEVRDQHDAIVRWAETSREGRRGELPFVPRPEVWAAVRAETGKCLGSKSPFYGPCAYQWSRRRMREASVLIVNHAVLMADLEGRRAGNPLLPDYRALIVDEAHHLEQVAAEHLGLRLSRAQILARLRELEESGAGRVPSVMGQSSRCRDLVDEFFDRIEGLLGEALTRRFPDRIGLNLELASALAALASTVDALGTREIAAAGEALDREADAEELRTMALSIELWAQGEDFEHVVWAERGEGGTMLRSAPRRPAEVLERELFDPLDAVVLTGATLRSPGGDDGFAHVRESTGLRGAVGTVLPSPFDYVRQVELVVEWLPDPSEGAAWERAVSERIPELIRSSQGRALVLFTSRQTMLRVAHFAREELAADDIEVLVQGRGLGRAALLERFRREQPAALFGLASFWEGVDVPGETLQHVILTRLPFAVPDHPLEEARAEALRARGLDPFQAHSLPAAVLRWKQGFGRLIRSRQDHGRVTVLDRRLLSRRFGRCFLDALPPCPRFLRRDGEEWPIPDDEA